MNNLPIVRAFLNLKIRTKLILTFLTITLIPLMVLTYLSDRATRAALTQSANNALFSVALQTAASIDTFIRDNIKTINIATQQPILREYLSLNHQERANSHEEEGARQVLSNLHNLNLRQDPDKPYLHGYTLLDREGTVLLDTHVPLSSETNPFIGRDWSDRSYFLQPLFTRKPYSSEIEMPVEEDEEAGIYFSALVTNEENQPLGVLVAHYSSQVIQDLIAEKNDLAGEGSFGVLFDENFIHLAHGTRPDVIFTTITPMTPERLAALQKARRLPDRPASELFLDLPELYQNLSAIVRNPVFQAEDVAAGQFSFEAQDIATGESTNQVAVARMETKRWLVAFFQPQEIFLAPANQQTTSILLISGLIVAGTVGAAVLAAQRLSTPLTRLTQVAERVAEGDLSIRAEADSKDEIGTLAQTFNAMTDRLQLTLAGLEQRVEERTALLRVSAEVGRAASSILDPDELIEQVVHLITEQFGYYYAAIFLVDEFGEWAELKSATGEAGEALKARNHRLRVGGKSMVGMAITTRKGRIALDVGEEAIRFDNPLLPYTRSEIALPLIAGNRAIGALDVQSTQEAAFSEQDIETLQNMANQVAVAIENARLFQEAQSRLEEITRLNKVFIQKGWRTFIQRSPHAAQLKGKQILTNVTDPIPDLAPAVQEGMPVFKTEQGVTSITLPLLLRGQIIGVLNLKSNKEDWTADELSIIQAVAGQAAIALENARLVEETQNIARREQQINEITTKIRQSIDIEAILKNTLSELSTVLGVKEASIQLGGSGESRTNGNEQEKAG